MIRLHRGPKPEVLVQNAVTWTGEFLRLKNGDTTVPEAAATRYRNPEIKTAVVADSHGKCIYCESRPLHVTPGQVEHILPKSVFPEKIVEWSNLGFVCPDCNREKSDFHDAEEPIVDPFVEDPADFLWFAGPMVFERAGSARGIVTIHKLALDRAELMERRAEHLRSLQTLLNVWARLPDGSARGAVAEQIRAHADDPGEYAAATQSFLEDAHF